MMHATSNQFRANANAGLANPTLQSALAKMKVGFPTKRAEAVAKLPEFDALRDRARDIKNHVLENIDWYLERFEQRVTRPAGMSTGRARPRRRARSCSTSASVSARAA
jgi:L-lactate dehydrogenase complex protein LldF